MTGFALLAIFISFFAVALAIKGAEATERDRIRRGDDISPKWFNPNRRVPRRRPSK